MKTEPTTASIPTEGVLQRSEIEALSDPGGTYSQLLVLCVKAILNKKPSLTIRCHRKSEFPLYFPKGKTISRDGDYNTRRLSTKHLFDWLYENGYTALTREDLSIAAAKFTNFEKELFK